jgi:ferredoxin--NADP+ reductase
MGFPLKLFLFVYELKITTFAQFKNNFNRRKIVKLMNKIISKTNFSKNVVSIEIEAPRIAKARKAGHFVIVRADKNGERIPLTISSANIEKGTVTLVIQKVGVSSRKLASLEVGDTVSDIVGPLGQATHVANVGTVLACGGGVGVAPLLPIVEAMKKAGNRVITIIAARTRELIILEEQMKAYSDELLIMTDDGSFGTKGLITEGMEAVIAREKVNQVIVIGPAIMMKFAALTTKKYDIPTIASLNTIMVDGTGMCGACRITVGGKTQFVCVDGPEFDAHQVDFDEMMLRLSGYREFEKQAEEEYFKGN